MIGNVAVRVDDDEDAELADEPAHYVGTDIRLELSPDPLPISVLVPIDATPQVAIYTRIHRRRARERLRLGAPL